MKNNSIRIDTARRHSTCTVPDWWVYSLGAAVAVLILVLICAMATVFRMAADYAYDVGYIQGRTPLLRGCQ